MSSNALVRVERQLEATRSRFADFRKRENSTVRTTIHGGLSTMTAFGMAYFSNRYEDKAEVFGMPVSLFVGGLAMIAQTMGWAGSESDLVGSVGIGSLCAFGAQKGFEKGHDAAVEAAQNP